MKSGSPPETKTPRHEPDDLASTVAQLEHQLLRLKKKEQGIRRRLRRDPDTSTLDHLNGKPLRRWRALVHELKMVSQKRDKLLRQHEKLLGPSFQ